MILKVHKVAQLTPKIGVQETVTECLFHLAVERVLMPRLFTTLHLQSL
jgi:hypothetical protein